MAADNETTYTIGQLAQAVGVNVETVRYYHRIGVLPAPERQFGSIRRYSTEARQRLRFIKRAQQLGFTLDEVAVLLQLGDGTHCAETKTLARQKLLLVHQKLADLQAIETALTAFAIACDTAPDEQHCPLIAALAADE